LYGSYFVNAVLVLVLLSTIVPLVILSLSIWIGDALNKQKENLRI
jgi:hypothetical protein